MTTAEVALAVSAVSLIAQGVNAWLHQRIRAELAELSAELLDKIDSKYVTNVVCQGRMELAEERARNIRRMPGPGSNAA